MPVNVIDDYGLPQTIDEAELPAALEQGWHVESPDEAQAREDAVRYSSLLERGKGVAEQFASGATVGLSDVALAELGGDEYRRARAGREKALGGLSTAAQLAGAVAPAIASLGESAPFSLARVATAPARGAMALGAGAEAATGAALRGVGIAGESLIGRAALTGGKLAAGGAVEGALYGAGEALSEAALAPGGNYDHLAEKLMAGAEHGAKFGALTGGALGFVGGATSRAIERGAEKLAGPGGLKRMLEDVSVGAGGRALGMPRAPFGPQAGTEARISKMVTTARDATLDDGTRIMRLGDNQETLAERVLIGEKQYGARIGKIAEDVDAAIEAGTRHVESIERTAAPAADIKWLDFLKGRMGPAMKAHGGDHTKAVRALSAEYKAAKAGGAGFTERVVRRTENPHRPDLRAFFAEVDDMATAAAMGPADLSSQARRAIKQVEALRTRYATGEATLGDVLSYRRKLDKLVFPEKAGGGIVVAKANAAELLAIRGKLEEAIEQTIAKADELVPGKLAEYQAAKATFGALKDARKISSQEIRRSMGRNRFSPIETLAQVGGGVAAVATGQIAPLVGGLAYSGARNLWRSRGEQVLAILADRAARSEQRVDRAVSRFVTAGKGIRRGAVGGLSAYAVEDDGRVKKQLAQRSAETKQAAYARKLKALRAFTPDQAPGFNDLATAAPQTAAGFAALNQRAKDYLLRTAPTELIETDPLQPQLKKPAPNPVDLEKWARRLEAVDDPVGTFERGLVNGRITKEHVDTLLLVYPQLFQQMQSKLQDELLASKTRVPYQQRIRLGMLFRIPTDPALEPRQMARTQAMYAQMRSAVAPAAPPGQTPPTTETLASRYATETQRLEQGIPPA